MSKRLIVVTGGPGAGKTAILELARRHEWRHVVVLPESASLLYGNGFPRQRLVAARQAAQRAIFHVQTELETVALLHADTRAALCDRGTLDGLAYWPGREADFLAQVGTTRERELARYAAVVHLRTPTEHFGYNHTNGLRIESAHHAREIDGRIEEAWRGHPRRHFVDATHDFLKKAERALALIAAALPAGCAASRRLRG